MTTESILDEAARILEGDRAEAYGDPTVMCQRIADLWTPILSACLPEVESDFGEPVKVTLTIRPRHVAMCLLQLKVAREVNRPKRDNRVDLAGYAAILDRVTPSDEPKQAETTGRPDVTARQARAKSTNLGSYLDRIFGSSSAPTWHTGGRVPSEDSPRTLFGKRGAEFFIPCSKAESFGRSPDDVTRKAAGPYRPEAEPITKRWAGVCPIDFSKSPTDSENRKTDFENEKWQAEKAKCEAAGLPTDGWWSTESHQFAPTEHPRGWVRAQVVLRSDFRRNDERRALAYGVMLSGTSLFWHNMDPEYVRIADMPAAVKVVLVEAAP